MQPLSCTAQARPLDIPDKRTNSSPCAARFRTDICTARVYRFHPEVLNNRCQVLLLAPAVDVISKFNGFVIGMLEFMTENAFSLLVRKFEVGSCGTLFVRAYG